MDLCLPATIPSPEVTALAENGHIALTGCKMQFVLTVSVQSTPVISSK